MSIRRAWQGTCADGHFRDQFANAVAHRITQVDNCPGDAHVSVELVDDFVDRCDALFAQHCPESGDAVAALAAEIDTVDLYDLLQND